METGINIIEGLRGHTSGLAVPTFVIDLPEGGGKVPIQPDYLLRKYKESMLLRNYEGNRYRYRNPRAETKRQPDSRKSVKVSKGTEESTGIPVPVRLKNSGGIPDENRVIL